MNDHTGLIVTEHAARRYVERVTRLTKATPLTVMNAKGRKDHTR